MEPVGYGERGERVVTSFGRGAIPLLRYRTGDLVCKVPAATCDCGRGFDIYEGGILGRVDDMKIIRGTNVYPRAIEAIVREFPEVDEFQTVITREGVRDEITLRVELKPDWDVTRWGPLAEDLHKRLALAHEGLNFRIERAGEGELPRFELKAKRTVDKRDAPIGAATMTQDLLGNEMTASEERLLAVYEELKALCDRGPAAGRRVERPRRAGARAPGGQRARARVRAPVRHRRLTMRIAVAGGGPGGLYFSILMRRAAPDCEITVFERNRSTDAFGFGVVFSDETLTVFEHADPVSYQEITDSFVHWTDIDIHHRGLLTRSGGHGFSALGRRELLGILQRRAISLGVDVRFSCEAPSLEELRWADLVVAADGASSGVRAQRAEDFVPSLDPRFCRYMWLGTDLVFDAFKFFIEETPDGVFQAHGYPYSDQMSTFIVETNEETWHRAGLDAVPAGSLPPGVSDEASVQFYAGAVRRGARRPPAVRQQLEVDQLRHGSQPVVALGQRRAARRRGPHRALLDRLRHEARDGGRGRAGVGVQKLR